VGEDMSECPKCSSAMRINGTYWKCPNPACGYQRAIKVKVVPNQAGLLRKNEQLKKELGELKIRISKLEADAAFYKKMWITGWISGSDSSPKSSSEISHEEVYRLLKSQFPKAKIYLSDSSYRLVIKSEIEKYLAEDKTDAEQYVAERYDCDDFSYRLMGQFSIPGWSDLTFGIVWTNLHALNCILDENRHFWFIEPQTDKLTGQLESWQGKEVALIIM